MNDLFDPKERSSFPSNPFSSVRSSAPHLSLKTSHTMFREPDLEPIIKEFNEKIAILGAQVNEMNCEHKEDVDEVLNLLQNHYESLRAEYKADLLITKSELLEKFQAIPDIIISELPNLIDQNLLDDSIERARLELCDHVSQLDSTLRQLVADSLRESKESILAAKEEYIDDRMKDMNNKLAWLPLKLNDLQGMNPIEARLFTLEARLRSEENNRIKIYDEIHDVFELLKKVQTKKELISRPETPQINRKASYEPVRGIEGKSLKIQRISLGAYNDVKRSSNENAFSFEPDLSILEMKFKSEKSNSRSHHQRVSSYNSSRFKNLPILSPNETTTSKAIVHSRYSKPQSPTRLTNVGYSFVDED